MAFKQPECHICHAKATITHGPYCSAGGIPEHYEIDKLRKALGGALVYLKQCTEKGAHVDDFIAKWEALLPPTKSASDKCSAVTSGEVDNV